MLQSFNHVYWRQKQHFLLNMDTYDAWVLFAVEEGAFQFRIGDAEGTCEAGAVVACPPGIPFHREALSPVTFHFIRLELTEQRPPLPEGKLFIANPARLSSNLSRLKRLSEKPGPDSEEMKRHLLQDMLYFCFADPAWEDPAHPVSDDPLMKEAVSHIRKHACEKQYNIAHAAMHVGLTPVQFSRRFQKAFRQKPIRFLTECRIRLARRLLTDTTLTLEEIAERSGYDNAFYLSRVFAQTSRMSPSAYRKAHRV